MGSRVAWFYGVAVVATPRGVGLGGVSNSSLVKVNENASSQRAGLLAVVSSSPSSCRPGSGKGRALSLCPKAPAVVIAAPHPLGADATAQQRGLSRDVRQQLGGRKAPGAVW